MKDQLYLDIKDTVSGFEYWSANQLMRKFNIGYNRACWYIEHLVEDGILESDIDHQGCRKTIQQTTKAPL